jgi:O-antigen/teichoic acid export membrane protein
LDLKNKTISGMFWVFVENVFLKGFSFVGTLLLAKMLTPTDFGLIAIITIFVSLGAIIVDSGLSSSLLRNMNNEESDYSTIFYVNLLLSLIMYFVVFFLAPVIAVFYEQSILTSIIRVYSLGFIISALTSIQTIILLKKLQFKKITYLSIPGVLLGNLIALLMGYYDYGVWSIVAMFLLPQLFQMIMMWLGSGWMPKRIFSYEKLKYHYTFGYKLLLTSLISCFVSNLYNLIIGKIYPLKTLGYYDRGNSLSQYPMIILTQVIGKVTLPILSEIQDNKEKFITVFKKLLEFSFFVTAPIMFGLSAIAKPLILILLGEKWLMSVPVLQIISIGGAFYTIQALNVNAIKIYGRSDLILKKEIIINIFFITTIVLSYFIGFYAFIWSIVLNSIFTTIINMSFSAVVVDFPLITQLKTISVVLVTCLLMYLLMYLVQKYLLVGVDPFFELVYMTIVGLISYFTFSFIFKSNSLFLGLELLKDKFGKQQTF